MFMCDSICLLLATKLAVGKSYLLVARLFCIYKYVTVFSFSYFHVSGHFILKVYVVNKFYPWFSLHVPLFLSRLKYHNKCFYIKRFCN